MVKDFIALSDFSASELSAMLDRAAEMKRDPQAYRSALGGKTLGMVFNKHSTRTRVSFEVGIYQLGGIGLFFGPGQLQLDRGEPISDTAKVLSRYLDGLLIRTFAHADVVELARHATIPVINGLTDHNHPCQIMADLLTVREVFGSERGRKLAYVGDGNNVALSLLAGCAKMGMDIALVCPPGYTLASQVVETMQGHAEASGATITTTGDLHAGVGGAHVVYTDVWASMGQESEQAARRAAFEGYQVTGEVMAMADADAVFMHCLPAHRGEEVSAEVIDGERSVVFDQAENRLHAQKAILHALMATEPSP
jgi:ornithine carbamoyltransferase